MLTLPVEYDPDWPLRFERYRDEIAGMTGVARNRIAHIGSTAVPGTWAKPIIDIQISVADLSLFDLSHLDGSGYQPVAHNDCDDPFPDACAGPAGWEKKYARLVRSDQRLAHIHIRQIGNPNHRFALLFRDFLRATPFVRDQYSDFKQTCAKLSQDTSDTGGTGDYLSLKDPFVRLIAHCSEHWATNTGWMVPR
jgi:dephospho-CoA kinase